MIESLERGGKVAGETRVLINGRQLAGLDPLDRGLHYGDGVFRTIRVEEGRARWWTDQFGKLAEDCKALGLPAPDRDMLEEEIGRLAADTAVGVIKIIVTRGSGRRGYGIPGDIEPARIVIATPPSDHQLSEVRVRWCDLRLASQPRLAGIKHLNRLENVLARSEWNDPDIAEGLLRDESGHVICGTMTNLFIVEKDSPITPDLSRCGVAGVARSRILRAAARHGREPKVEAVSRERLLEADGAFLCNSLIGVWRVAELEDRHWPDSGWAKILRNWLDEDHQ